MGKQYDRIEPPIREFIEAQQMFFVATAPLSANGHINVSPKGLDSLRILDDQTVAYVDLIGSGIETVAHVRENGRIVIMFCAFAGAPKIVRLHGSADIIEPISDAFAGLASAFPEYSGVRAIIRVRCSRITDSCGFGVPLYEFQSQRTKLVEWAHKKGAENLSAYVGRMNARSVDGLPGVDRTSVDQTLE